MQQERDLEETKRINIEIMMQIEEGKKQNIKEDRDTTNKLVFFSEFTMKPQNLLVCRIPDWCCNVSAIFGC